MYLTHTKTMFIEAIRETFDHDYPTPRLRDIHVSMEYPVQEQHYPSIWVDYEDADALSNMGIAHVEHEIGSDGKPTRRKLFRWQFKGWVQITMVALSALERDTIYDELIRAVAFGRANPDGSILREKVENNDLVAISMDWDQIQPRGAAAAPGTMWGTDDIMYERSIALQVIGEFVSEPFGGELYDLTKIIWEGYYDDGTRPITQEYFDERDPWVSGQVPRE